jgi:hypothetical protein
MAVTLAPVTPQAPLQQTTHGVSGTSSSVVEWGSIHSSTKSAKTCDFIALRFSKSTTYSDSSIPHLLIFSELSLLPKMLFSR